MADHRGLPTFIPVRSSNVKGIAYRRGTMYVQFKDGHVYTYEDVGPEVFEAVRDAPSHGAALHLHIVGKYRHAKLSQHPLTVQYEEPSGDA